MPSKTKSRRDIHQEVTDTIIAALETSDDNWQRPWVTLAKSGLPHNAVTGKSYRGINSLLLWIAADKRGYLTQVWAGFKQWQEKGAAVRKGEKGTIICYVGSAPKRGQDGKPELDENGDEIRYTFIKHSHVWNAAQVDGYEAGDPPAMPDLAERLAHCEAFVTATRAIIQYGGDRAYYSPNSDHIGMPLAEAFKGSATSTATECFYSTLLHELTHWTGHKSRCDRFETKAGGIMTTADREDYAREELVAELGAAFLCAELGISNDPRPDHAQYLQHWLKALKRDNRAIFKAVGLATKAADFLHDLQDVPAEAIAA